MYFRVSIFYVNIPDFNNVESVHKLIMDRGDK